MSISADGIPEALVSASMATLMKGLLHHQEFVETVGVLLHREQELSVLSWGQRACVCWSVQFWHGWSTRPLNEVCNCIINSPFGRNVYHASSGFAVSPSDKSTKVNKVHLFSRMRRFRLLLPTFCYTFLVLIRRCCSVLWAERLVRTLKKVRTLLKNQT